TLLARRDWPTAGRRCRSPNPGRAPPRPVLKSAMADGLPEPSEPSTAAEARSPTSSMAYRSLEKTSFSTLPQHASCSGALAVRAADAVHHSGVEVTAARHRLTVPTVVDTAQQPARPHRPRSS